LRASIWPSANHEAEGDLLGHLSSHLDGVSISKQRVAHARFDDYITTMAASTVNARKSNRRSLTMLAALVAIALLADGLGLVIHYSFANNVTREVPASSQTIQ
jgi:hypothetical protein